MEQYISKSALVAEIRKKVDSYRGDGIISIGALKQHCEDFIYSLNNLEEKEVDFEEELKYYCNDYYNCDYPKQLEEETCSDVMPHIVSAAKHFFELGMQVSNKPQKEK